MKSKFCLGLILFAFPALAVPASPSPSDASTNVVAPNDITAADTATHTKIPTGQPIEIKRAETDRQIQNRLQRIARSQEVFSKIEVLVSEGIVTVKGQVEEAAYAKSFTGLSEKVEGVIGVVDELEITNKKKTGLRLAQSEVNDLSQKFYRFLPYLAACFLLLLLTVFLGTATFRIWQSILTKRLSKRPMLAQHLARIFTVPVYFLGFYLILKVGGMTGLAATLVGGTGMLGIAIGLASRNILENYLSSFMLSLRNPFNVGDNVNIGSETGIVHRVDSRCTTLLGYDGILTQIPNSVVLNAVIKNISAHPLNRVIVDIKLSRRHSAGDFIKEFDRVVNLHAKSIASDPKPQAVVTQLTEYTAKIQCTFWLDTKQFNTDRTRSSVLQALQLYILEKNKAVEAEEQTPAGIEVKKAALQIETEASSRAAPEKDAIVARTKEIRKEPGEKDNLI